MSREGYRRTMPVNNVISKCCGCSARYDYVVSYSIGCLIRIRGFVSAAEDFFLTRNLQFVLLLYQLMLAKSEVNT
jgi:hypothetical protein